MKVKIVKNTKKVRGETTGMSEDCYVVFGNDSDDDDEELTSASERKNAVKKSKSKEKYLKNKRILPMTISGMIELEVRDDGSIDQVDTGVVLVN